MAKVLGYGIIGCGYVCERHINAIKNLDGAKLVAVSDISEDRLKGTVSKFKVGKCFTDYNQLINLKEVDVVVILVPDYLHMEIAVKAAQAGKHVCLEKPIARTLPEAKETIDACRINKVKLFVMQSMRFYPAWQKAKQLIKSGYLGSVFKIKAKNCGYCDFSHGAINWKWRFNPQLGSGVLGDIGVHYADSFRYLLDADPISVYAEMETVRKEDVKMADNALLLLRFANNVIAEIEVSLSQREALWKERIEVYGTDGSLSFSTSGKKIELYSIKIGKEPDGMVKVENLDPVDFTKIWARLHLQFMESIKQDNVSPVTGRDGYKAVEVISAAYKSAETERAVSLPLII